MATKNEYFPQTALHPCVTLNEKLDEMGMSRKEFFSLQNDCLSACYHVEKAGEIAVLDNLGNFQNKELEGDAKTVILLTVQSLAFNVTDFFDGEFLQEFSTTVKGMMPSPVGM